MEESYSFFLNFASLGSGPDSEVQKFDRVQQKQANFLF